jgi:hypothetical protein
MRDETQWFGATPINPPMAPLLFTKGAGRSTGGFSSPIGIFIRAAEWENFLIHDNSLRALRASAVSTILERPKVWNHRNFSKV